MKIAVISDIHSNLNAFEAVIKALPEFDELFCLGDMVGYGPQPNEVVERLRLMKPRVVLAGNHDRAVVTGDVKGFSANAAAAVGWTRMWITRQNREYLSSLEPLAKLKISDVPLALYHGSPNEPLTEYIFPGLSNDSAKGLIEKAEASIVLLGHTHMPMLYQFGSELLANPGSVGQPRDGDPRASYATLSICEGKFTFEVKRVKYDIDPVANKIHEAGLPGFLAERLYIGM